MALSIGTYMEKIHDTIVANGDPAMSSDGKLVIDGYENFSSKLKAFPWPTISPGEAVEVPTELGGAYWVNSQSKFNQQGSITLQETVVGGMQKDMLKLISEGGYFNGWVYEGNQEHWYSRLRIKRATINLEPGERDWENRTQILTLTGQISYMFFGEIEYAKAGKEAYAHQQ